MLRSSSPTTAPRGSPGASAPCRWQPLRREQGWWCLAGACPVLGARSRSALTPRGLRFTHHSCSEGACAPCELVGSGFRAGEVGFGVGQPPLVSPFVC